MGPAKVLILHVGRLAVERDVDTLVRTTGGSSCILCSRYGPRAMAVRSGLHFAHHLGFLDRVTLADLYADADLFVFPSPTETCGLVALETMAAGLPVLTSDAGGVRENLRHGLNGRPAAEGQRRRLCRRHRWTLTRQRPTGRNGGIRQSLLPLDGTGVGSSTGFRPPNAEAMLTSAVPSAGRSLLADRPII